MNTFIICGYGIPSDIASDINYTTYLHTVFNQIFEQARNHPALIIPCGGPTACEEPFDRTEAHIIAQYLESLKNRSETAEQTAQWDIVEENRSLSTLENLLFAKEIVDQKEASGSVTIFCEKLRTKRVRTIGENVFSTCTVQGIDFDISKNRYLAPEVIANKEQAAITESLWTLEDPARLSKHHELYEAKFAFFRQKQAEGISHVDVVEEWFKKGPELLRDLMPNHPLLD